MLNDTKELKIGDFVYITNETAKQFHDLAKSMWKGGVITKIENDVAEIEIITVERIHISKLTTDDNAYDPIL